MSLKTLKLGLIITAEWDDTVFHRRPVSTK